MSRAATVSERPVPHTRAVERLWDRATVEKLAADFAALAARELTRVSGPVRDPEFLAKTRAVLADSFGPADLVSTATAIADASLHLSHPRFMAQQVAAPVPAAALVESVVAALNNSIAVWDMSPAATLIDRDLIGRFRQLFRYPRGANGSFVPGGSYANLTALLAARAALVPRAWRSGAARIAILAGEHTHYSISRAVGILGLGTDAVFPIGSDAAFRTDPGRVSEAMRRARAAGFRKFILIATSGSTPTGSCDDLEAFAALARRHNAWFHVDAAHGGGFLFSPRLKRLLRGIEHCDSLAFDPHKMLFMPLTAGAVLVRSGTHVRDAFEQHAPYLFGGRKKKFDDIGQFTIACSQRFDALKVWLTWKAYGEQVWAELIDGVCAAARTAYEYCSESELLEPVHEPQCNIFCFRLRHTPPKPADADALHWSIKEAVNATGEAYISSTVLDRRRVLRIVVMNPRTTADDVRGVLQLVERQLERRQKRSYA